MPRDITSSYRAVIRLIKILLLAALTISANFFPATCSAEDTGIFAVKEFGANRIMWGSNFPAAKPPLPELVALARNALSFLPQQDQDWIFFKTAQTLYPALGK